MTTQVIPQIGAEGTFSLKSPFDTLITNNSTYTCVAVREFTDFQSNGIDVYDTFYSPYSLDKETYTTDSSNNVCIVSLYNGGNWIYVPTSYILSSPGMNGVRYSCVLMGINLGAIPDTLDLTALEQVLIQDTLATVGIEPTVKQVIVSAPAIVNFDSANQFEAARKAKITRTQTDYSLMLQAQYAKNQAIAQLNAIQGYIATALQNAKDIVSLSDQAKSLLTASPIDTTTISGLLDQIKSKVLQESGTTGNTTNTTSQVITVNTSVDSDNNVTISGTAQAVTRLLIVIENTLGVQEYSVVMYTDASGNYSVVVPTMTEGSYIAVVSYSTSETTTGGVSKSFTVGPVTTTPESLSTSPTVSIAYTANGSGSVTFTGAASANAILTLVLADGNNTNVYTGMVIADGNGNYSITINNLAATHYTTTIKYSDVTVSNDQSTIVAIVV